MVSFFPLVSKLSSFFQRFGSRSKGSYNNWYYCQSHYYFTPSEFFTPALAGGISLKSSQFSRIRLSVLAYLSNLFFPVQNWFCDVFLSSYKTKYNAVTWSSLLKWAEGHFSVNYENYLMILNGSSHWDEKILFFFGIQVRICQACVFEDASNPFWTEKCIERPQDCNCQRR